MSIQTDDEETIYQAYSAGEMASEIIRLRAVFVAETQRREAAEAVVDILCDDDRDMMDADLLAKEYRALYPKESFDWQCQACGRTNPSTDTHCGCRYESPEEA